MKKAAAFLVDRRRIILSLFVVLAVICLFLMGRVQINYDMSVYLPPESGMKQGLELMNREFGETVSSDLRVMFSGLSEGEKEEIRRWLSGLEQIADIAWEPGDEYNRDGYTLFEISLNHDSHSKEAAAVYQAVHQQYDSRGVITGGSIDDANVPLLPPRVLIISVSLMLLVLFAMCNSWFEPVVFLLNIGIAIAINLGTNVILGSVSDYTMSMVTVLQMVLSMDYSIILLNRYMQEKDRETDNLSAMKAAIVSAFPAVAGSSLTTFVGLLSLVFMSFRIGADIGIALAKSVLVSLVCVFTVLPALILISDRWIVKTRKKALRIPMGRYSRCVFKGRVAFALLFILLFIGVFFLKNDTEIRYILDTGNQVDAVFEKSNPLVLLYETKDSDRISRALAGLEKDEKIRSVTGYYNTLGREYRADEITDLMGSGSPLDPAVIRLVYTARFADTDSLKVPVRDLFTLVRDQARGGNLPVEMDDQTLQQLDTLILLSDPEASSVPMTAEQLSSAMGVDSTMISMLFMMSGAEKLSAAEFIGLIADSYLTNPLFSSFIDEATAKNITALQRILSSAGSELTAAGFSEAFGSMGDGMLDTNTVSLLYLYYASQHAYDETWSMTPASLIGYISDSLLEDERFSVFITDGIRQSVAEAKAMLEEGAAQLEGRNYGRVIINSVYPEDAGETRAFLRSLSDKCAGVLEGQYYLIGSSAMNEEMSRTFSAEMNRITLISAAAIFIVVALTFRSLIIPLILVLIVQCGVYLTMAFIGLSGSGIYYMALLIVQCILMGATIDYGILYTTYYREYRQSADRMKAIEKAYCGALNTILTSSLIMILVTGVLSFVFASPAIGEICLSISRGTFCATVLVIFVLPGILAAADRLIIRSPKRRD